MEHRGGAFLPCVWTSAFRRSKHSKFVPKDFICRLPVHLLPLTRRLKFDLANISPRARASVRFEADQAKRLDENLYPSSPYRQRKPKRQSRYPCSQKAAQRDVTGQARYRFGVCPILYSIQSQEQHNLSLPPSCQEKDHTLGISQRIFLVRYARR